MFEAISFRNNLIEKKLRMGIVLEGLNVDKYFRAFDEKGGIILANNLNYSASSLKDLTVSELPLYKNFSCKELKPNQTCSKMSHKKITLY